MSGYTTPLCGSDLHACEEGETIAAIYSEWEGDSVAAWVDYLLKYKEWKTSPLRGIDVKPGYDLPRITIETTFRTSWTQDPPDPRNTHSAPYTYRTSPAVEQLGRDGNRFWITVDANGIVNTARSSRQSRGRAPAGQNPYGTDAEGRPIYWDTISLDSTTLRLIDPATYLVTDETVSFVTELGSTTRVWDWYR